jgi:RNA polymerase sigma-70 factor (ECF subfamily)
MAKMVTVAAMADPARTLEAIYREDGDRLWHALLAFARDPDLASDAVAEAYAQALRRGSDLRDPQAWVWRAGFRIAAGELKERSKRAGDRTSVLPDSGYLDPEVDSDLLDALARLPEKQRAAVILFYYADAPVAEIARRTGMSAISVRVNLSRGRQRLKQLLGETDA